jgi:hypothetical protein
LECYLSECGISWSIIEQPEHVQLEHEWNAVFGAVFSNRQRHRHGAKAEVELASRTVQRFRVVPFLGPWGGPHCITKRRHAAAYDCAGDLVPLGEFCAIDFFLAPPELEWTMIHEDHALGGPYFIDRDWLVDRRPPKRSRGRRRRWD